ncbi:Uncharacterised protein [Mycobacterium tuberculosis]|uniref:Uncharacterized protein n=1 Tax=Mycobacterium tuberculosis TaxID=1773 RepID=A0A655FY21_MYCTX|nr:Uncharacterised protein [Mycobacterium tuberculosis]
MKTRGLLLNEVTLSTSVATLRLNVYVVVPFHALFTDMGTW